MANIRDLMPGARNCVKDWAYVKPGDSVVIMSDTSIDPLVSEAYCAAALEYGAEAGVITLKGLEGKSRLQLNELDMVQWWPKWAWEAMLGADVVINLTMWLEVRHLDFFAGWAARRLGLEKALYEFPLIRQNNLRFIRCEIATPGQLASNWATYPRELVIALGRKGYDQCKGGNVVRITDPEGTDLTFKGYQFVSDRPPSHPYQIFQGEMIGLDPARNTSATGIIVSSRLHCGPIPPMRIVMEEGRVIHSEGGGIVGEEYREIWKMFEDIEFGNWPGPGITWLDECMWGTHPKARRFHEGLAGSSEYWGWMGGSRRSGTLHFALGSGGYPKVAVDEENWPKGHLRHHRDLEMYRPTVWIDGKKLIEDGHLLALDDPDIREVAKKYGDPNQLLKEEWEPIGVPL